MKHRNSAVIYPETSRVVLVAIVSAAVTAMVLHALWINEWGKGQLC